MAAPRVEEYVTQAFQGTQVTVEVVKGQATFEAEYPCLAAVNRQDFLLLCTSVERYRHFPSRWVHLKVVSVDMVPVVL
jgi:hypothetical protein